MQHTSRCIRCGKMRVVAKSWSEKINNSLVTYTLTICPDPECQRIVEEQLQKKKDKITSMHKEAEKRKKDNIRNRQIRKTLLSSGTKRHFRI